MQRASFSFDVDAGLHLLRISMEGFFAEDDIALFAAARDDAYLQLRGLAHDYRTIVDIREMQIQSQESVSAFQRLLSRPDAASTPIAFVVSKSLARLQIKRAAADRKAAYFTTVEDAERWLLSLP